MHRNKQAKWGEKRMFQTRKQDLIPEKEPNETKVSCLLHKEFKVIVIKMLIKLCKLVVNSV